MTCLFCRGDSTKAQGLAHVFPEALISNRTTLPRGAVCDDCNNYLGRKLDAQILEHPLIPLIIQLAGLPGKRGKVRQRVGHVERAPDGTVYVPINEPAIGPHPKGGTTASFELIAGQVYDDRKFSRALHHIALCVFCKHFGSPAALAARFDPVRDYVRQPKVREFWPYVRTPCDLSHLRLEMTGGSPAGLPAEVVWLRIFNLDFYVSLVREALLIQCVPHLPPGHTLIEQPAAPTKEERGSKRYRVSFPPVT